MRSMGDDPNQDLPVKETAATAMQPLAARAGSAKQVAVPHALRSDLEDRYLNLRQENDGLKTTLQKQEDKVKRLGAKLMRLMSEQKQRAGGPEARRALELQTTLAEREEHIAELQAANRMLQERVNVMRRQLLEQGRLRARIPTYPRGPTPSPATTPRRRRPPDSENPTSQPEKPLEQPESSRDGEMDKLQAQVAFLLQEKAGLCQRLEEAELQDRKRQVTENMELIRLRRSLAQQVAQLAALEERAQAAERDHAQAHQALAATQREAEGAQQQRNVLKKRVLDLEVELQSLQSERWRTLELEVAVKDLQRERDALQGQNARLLAMAEERATHHQGQGVHAAQLQERLIREAAKRAALQEQLCSVEKELADVKSQANSPLAPGSHRNSGTEDRGNSLLSQVGRLEADLTQEMRERVQLLQTLEKLRSQQCQPPPPREAAVADVRAHRTRTAQLQDGSSVQHIEQERLSATSSQRRQEPPTSASSHGLQEAPCPVIDLVDAQPGRATEPRECRSVGCVTEPETRLSKCVQVVMDEGQSVWAAGQPQRVPSLEQSKLAVMSRAVPGAVLRIPTLAASARLPDEPHSEATDADVSLLADKSPGEVSSESVAPFVGSECCPPDKSEQEASSKITTPVNKSLGEVSSEKPHNLCHVTEKSQGEVSSCVDGSVECGGLFASDKCSMADHLETVHELEKCRDVLRVQCRINSTLQDEVTRLRQHLGQAGTGHARQLAELRRRLEERGRTPGPRPLAPRGLFELHMGRLQLSPRVASELEHRNLFLSWVLCDQEVNCTAAQPASTLPVDYQHPAVYQVDVDHSFLDYLRSEACEVELYSLSEEGSRLEGRGFLHFAELLRFPRNKLHATVTLLSPDGSSSVGTAHCWFRLVLPSPADLAQLSEQDGVPVERPCTTPSSSAPVAVSRLAFPFSSPATPGFNAAPTPAPRCSLRPPQQDSSTSSAADGAGEGDGGEEDAARMKQLADSVLGRADTTQHRLAQILEEKWRQRKLTAASQHIFSGSPSSSREQSGDDCSAPIGAAQMLEVWLDYVRLKEDSEAMLSDGRQLQFKCSCPGRDGPTTVTSPLFDWSDSVDGSLALRFHTAFRLDPGEVGSESRPSTPPLDLDAGKLHFLIGCVPEEGGGFRPLGRASGDLAGATRVVGRAQLRLDVVDAAGSVVGELGVSTALTSDGLSSN